MAGLTKAQQAVISSGLSAARGFGFALAGSGALIVHGIASRSTDDADWFSTLEYESAFDDAVAAVTKRLESDGFTVEPVFREGSFFKFGVVDRNENTVEVDMSLDWRRYNPAEISIGPVLDIQDAAAAKVATIYSRGEARDFIDLWFIRRSELWTDPELFAMAVDRDPGIESEQFSQMLKMIDKYDDARFALYGLTVPEIEAVRLAASDFDLAILDPSFPQVEVPDHTGEVHVRSHPRAGAGVRHHWRSRPKR